MEVSILRDIVIILGLSVLIILICQRIRLPAILGFFLTGVIVGPHGLNIVKAIHEVELLAEIGIIFLLFVIGIEFSLKGLTSIKRTVLLGGFLQVGGTIMMVTIVLTFFGMSLPSSIFMGFLLSLSSTAIVLKMLQEKGELSSPHGKVSIAILIFQDIVVVLMMLLIPLLAGEMKNPMLSLFWLLVKVVGIVISLLLIAHYLIPVLFKSVVRAKNRELFILTVIGMCFATAWLTSSIGLSLALGAFFAGLIISESDYSHQTTANILPFREIFMSFFFVSIGMLLDFHFFMENFIWVILATIAVILVKMTVIGLSAYLLKYSIKTILMTSLAIFQVGEFSFLLSTKGMEFNLLSEDVYQYFLAISIISMGATPFVIQYAPNILKYLLKAPLPEQMKLHLKSRVKRSLENGKTPDISYSDHLVIIGYGLNGENVAKAARKANISYVIVEIDHAAIQRAKKNHEPVLFGDATNEVILKHIAVQEARIVVIAISAHQATRQIVKTIRTMSDTTYILVRTRYIKEVEEILRLGANEVIPEEFETSIEIFARVLRNYMVPIEEISVFIQEVRSHNYEMLRNMEGITDEIIRLRLPEMEIVTITVKQEKNEIVGKKIKDAQIRKKYGVSILAINRGEEYITDVTPDMIIQNEDMLYLFGKPSAIQGIKEYFS